MAEQPIPTETATVPQKQAAPAPAPETTHTAVKETFVDGAGNLYQVDQAQAGQMKAMGLRPASLDETIQAEHNKIGASAVGKVIAATTGAVPGLSTALVKGAELYGE